MALNIILYSWCIELYWIYILRTMHREGIEFACYTLGPWKCNEFHAIWVVWWKMWIYCNFVYLVCTWVSNHISYNWCFECISYLMHRKVLNCALYFVQRKVVNYILDVVNWITGMVWIRPYTWFRKVTELLDAKTWMVSHILCLEKAYLVIWLIEKHQIHLMLDELKDMLSNLILDKHYQITS